MEHIAFYGKYFSVTWHAVIMTLAIAAGIITSVYFCMLKGLQRSAALATAALSFILSPLLSRLLYWYCCPEQYDGVFDALTSFSGGGHALLGAMTGVIISAVIVRRLGIVRRLTDLLDCLAPSGALAIAVGRLSSAFTSDDYGKMTFDSPSAQRFPISSPVAEPGTDTVLWRFPTYFYESAAAAVICVLLIVILLRRCSSGVNKDIVSGSAAMMFTVMFSAMQIVLESTRYDALFFRSNGFVSIFQIIGALSIVGAYIFFAVRTVRNGGKILPLCRILYLVTLAMFVTAGIMEYLVQRYAGLYYVFYPIMLLAMLIVCASGYVLCLISEGRTPFGGKRPGHADTVKK